MPSRYLIISEDENLVRAWESQLPPGLAVRLNAAGQSLSKSRYAGILVVIVEAAHLEVVPKECSHAHLLVVGDEDDTNVVVYRTSWRGRVLVQSVEESKYRLRQIATLCMEHAELTNIIGGVRALRGPPSLVPDYRGKWEVEEGDRGCGAIWEFVANALEYLHSKSDLIRECVKGYRLLLECSQVKFFGKSEDGYSAAREPGEREKLAVEDPLVALLRDSPVILDGRNWPDDCDPVSVLSIRNWMELWNCRLVVPVHENGELLGIVVCGVRNDGISYDLRRRSYAVRLARAMAQLLSLNSWLEEVDIENRYNIEYRKQFPNTLIINQDEVPPQGLPLAVRRLISAIKTSRSAQYLRATIDQPFRVSGGFSQDTERIWVAWEEASAEVYEHECLKRRERLALLKELALTLNHELGNALVSLAILADPHSAVPKVLHPPIREDIRRLTALNDQISQLAGIQELSPEYLDIRLLVAGIGERYGFPTEICSEPLVLHIIPKLIELALNVVASCLTEGRDTHSSHGISLQLRSAGVGQSMIALISFRGNDMTLEGILPQPVAESPPNQGRMLLFIAKEIMFLHHGLIHSGPGLESSEIMITLRHL